MYLFIVGGVSAISAGDDDEFQDASAGDKWGGDDDDLFGDEDEEGGAGGGAKKKAAMAEASSKTDGKEGKGWGDDDDLDLSDDEAPAVATAKGKGGSAHHGGAGGDGGSYFVAPTGGTPATVTWCSESSHAADHLAAGSAESALQLLNRQIAVVNAAPMKTNGISLFLGATAFLPGLPLVPSNKSYLFRDQVYKYTVFTVNKTSLLHFCSCGIHLVPF
jgi:coatomer protein complex subunit alpha (xenin)